MQFPGFKRSIKITTEMQALHHIAPCSFPELALLQPQLVLELTKQLAQQSIILQEVPDGYASGLRARLLTAAEQQHSWTISPLPLLAGQYPCRTGSLCSPYLWGICNSCAACLSSTPRPRPAPSPFLHSEKKTFSLFLQSLPVLSLSKLPQPGCPPTDSPFVCPGSPHRLSYLLETVGPSLGSLCSSSALGLPFLPVHYSCSHSPTLLSL